MHRRRLLRSLGLGGLGLVAAACGVGADGSADRRGSEAEGGEPSGGAAAGDGGPAGAGEGTDALRSGEQEPGGQEPGGQEPGGDEAGGEDPDAAEEAQTSPRRRVEVLCREALGLREAQATNATHSPSRLTLHHTAVELAAAAQAPSRLRGHQRHHRNQGWIDIAYHFAVDLAGNVYELRDPTVPGDTFTDYDPAGHLHLVCEGNFDEQEPTDALLDGVAQLAAALAPRYGVPASTLDGHQSYVSTTACPGRHLRARMDELRREAERLVATGAPALEQRCGPEAERRVAAIEAG